MKEELQDKYIRFDWAIKRLLRQKANFDVLEGFLTVFLGEKITIVDILESEGNQQSADDKFNRVDIKARNSKDEIIIVEIQNTRELYYLERGYRISSNDNDSCLISLQNRNCHVGSGNGNKSGTGTGSRGND